MHITLFQFLSQKKQTPIAPEWNYILGETVAEDIDFKKIAKFMLSKEKEILKLQTNKKISDGYTGLGENSTTAKFSEYNIFTWDNNEVQKLKEKIKELHYEFLDLIKIDLPKDLYIQCWVNIMRKGQKINPHIHSTDPHSYLGGHIVVQCENTSTYYICPQNQLSSNEPSIFNSKNEVGKMTIFQNCIPHYTDTHMGDKERITIAFDLHITESAGRHYNKIKL